MFYHGRILTTHSKKVAWLHNRQDLPQNDAPNGVFSIKTASSTSLLSMASRKTAFKAFKTHVSSIGRAMSCPKARSAQRVVFERFREGTFLTFFLSLILCACQGAENAGRRLAAKLAAHPFSPRTAQQSLDWLWVRVRRGCTAIFAPSALFPGISRRCTWRSVASTQAQRRYRVSSLS